jgi:cell division protein FtsI/penicillin-binding protein 2
MSRAGVRAQRGRLHALSALFLGVGLLLVWRLFQLQIIEHEWFVEQAREERYQTKTLPAKRGSILDANGAPLAVSVLYERVEVVGSQVRDPNAAANKLAALLGLSPEDVRAKIDPASKSLVLLKSPLPSALAAEVANQKLDGVYLRPIPVRTYPEGSIAAQVLGFVGHDASGLAGLELSYDEELAGVPGEVKSERDTVGHEIALGERVVVEPKQGADLVLTIDRFVQRLAERTLADAVATNKALGGLILIMEPNTGAILAMASLPTYSLTDGELFRPGEEALLKSVQVTNQYEPGSVMKVITMAAGLEERKVTPKTTVNDTGSIEVGGAVLRNWDLQANGVIDMTRVLLRSSNVGTQYVSGLLGPDLFYHYIGAFGFGQLTGVRLPGEVSGTVRSPADEGWTRVDLATNAYGQGIAVTPVQMLTAVSAIANGGVLMKPQIVRSKRRGEQVEPVTPEPVRQVISAETARTLTEMMIEVLEQPALDAHRLPGYRFAGKTGTADFPTNLGYTSGKTYASVVAFGPLPDPRLSILIRLDAPEAIYGGLVAAPVLKSLLQELMPYYRIPAADRARPPTRPAQ